MPVREAVDRSAFNPDAQLPFELRLNDFEIAMQDVYDFFYDVNVLFDRKGLPRLGRVCKGLTFRGCDPTLMG